MIDHANEEQDVRDLSNFLALLLRGAEVSTGTPHTLLLTLLVSLSIPPLLILPILLLSSLLSFSPSYFSYSFTLSILLLSLTLC